MNKYHEVYNPKDDQEYWVVVDEERCIPHYFKEEQYARAYAEDKGFTIVFQECFN
jgi:hypothetical protein